MSIFTTLILLVLGIIKSTLGSVVVLKNFRITKYSVINTDRCNRAVDIVSIAIKTFANKKP